MVALCVPAASSMDGDLEPSPDGPAAWSEIAAEASMPPGLDMVISSDDEDEEIVFRPAGEEEELVATDT